MNIYENKTILITGGCGSIGSELVLQILKQKPKQIRVFDNRESGHFQLKQKTDSPLIRYLIGDVRDRDRLMRAMEGVDIVFNAAALKHVDLCEFNPFDAVLTNAVGTKNSIEAAIERKVKYFITISTDKAVNPVNTMGATKLLAEKMTINAPIGNTEMLVACARFGNVLNSDGSVIPLFKNQISQGKPLTVTSPEMTRFFMTISEAASLILQIPKHMKPYPGYYPGGDIFVLNNMKSFKIIDLAQALGDYYKHSKKIKIIGIRPGEKIHETLFSEEEVPYVKKLNGLFVIQNQMATTPSKENPIKIPSSNEVQLLSKAEITKLLHEYKII